MWTVELQFNCIFLQISSNSRSSGVLNKELCWLSDLGGHLSVWVQKGASLPWLHFKNLDEKTLILFLAESIMASYQQPPWFSTSPGHHRVGLWFVFQLKDLCVVKKIAVVNSVSVHYLQHMIIIANGLPVKVNDQNCLYRFHFLAVTPLTEKTELFFFFW